MSALERSTALVKAKTNVDHQGECQANQPFLTNEQSVSGLMHKQQAHQEVKAEILTTLPKGADVLRTSFTSSTNCDPETQPSSYGISPAVRSSHEMALSQQVRLSCSMTNVVEAAATKAIDGVQLPQDNSWEKMVDSSDGSEPSVSACAHIESPAVASLSAWSAGHVMNEFSLTGDNEKTHSTSPHKNQVNTVAEKGLTKERICAERLMEGSKQDSQVAPSENGKVTCSLLSGNVERHTGCSDPLPGEPSVVPEPPDLADAREGLNSQSGEYQSSCLSASTGFSQSIIQTRAKERKHYTDDGIDEDEIEGKRSYSVEDKLKCNSYKGDFVMELKGEEFNLKFIQEKGLVNPIIFLDKAGLGMRVPSENFQVSDVKQCVGSRRTLDVMDVNTQRGLEMSMKDWVKYYENSTRNSLLNVISLEFSHTRLENYVESPTLVRQIDWVDTVWPRHLKECQTEATNIIDKMKYPKVQKYCLMSVEGCYTDFHVDFGGTSVWYHILHGEKVICCLCKGILAGAPTEENLSRYEDWVLSAKQGDVFLADHMDHCQKVTLKAGYTFIIPSGWIHAVYTPKDSLVFGGNFLHSFNIPQQLRVAGIEDRTHVPQKFRYPFYTEIMWYVMDRYLSVLLGRSYVKKPVEKEKEDTDDRPDSPASSFIDDDSRPPSRNPDSRPPSRNPNEASSAGKAGRVKVEGGSDGQQLKVSKNVTVELTRIDANTLKVAPNDEDSNPARKSSRTVPKNASGSFVDSVKSEMMSSGESDSELIEANGFKFESEDKENSTEEGTKKDGAPGKWVHLTKWELEGLQKLVEHLESLAPNKRNPPKDLIDPASLLKDFKQLLLDHKNDDVKNSITGNPLLTWPESEKPKIVKPRIKLAAGKGKAAKGSSSAVRRRRTRCKKCEACTRNDCGECSFCKDMRKYGGPGRMKQSCISRQCMRPVLPHTATCVLCDEMDSHAGEEGEVDEATTLMECGICWEIVHPACLRRKYENLDNESNMNEDLPNSWECPKCCHDGKQGQLKPRILKGGMKPLASSAESRQTSSSSEAEEEEEERPQSLSPVEGKRVTAKEALASTSKMPLAKPGRRPSLDKGGKLLKKAIQHGRDKDKSMRQKIHASPKKLSPRKKGLHKGAGPSGASPLVTTRSGRKVKRSTADMETDSIPDSMAESSRKRPRREGHSPEREGYATRSRDVSPAGSSLSVKLRGRTGRSRMPRDADTSEQTDGAQSISSRGPKGQVRAGASEGSGSQGGRGSGGSDQGDGSNGPSGQTPMNKLPPPEVVTALGGARELRVVLERHVVRPAPIPGPPQTFALVEGGNHSVKHAIWMKIFSYLPRDDLARCLAVCRVWNRWVIHPSLWKKLDLKQVRIKKVHLMGLVRRQPQELNLSGAQISKEQLGWLVARLPQLHRLDVSYGTWGAICALCSSSCPLLRSLDLSWVEGVRDDCIHDLLIPPVDRRPAVRSVSRMHKLTELSLAGTDITDRALSLVHQHATQLKSLRLDYCVRLTDTGVAALLEAPSPFTNQLQKLDLSGCRLLTDAALQHVRSLTKLTCLNLQSCNRVTTQACQRFADSFPYTHLTVVSERLIQAPNST